MRAEGEASVYCPEASVGEEACMTKILDSEKKKKGRGERGEVRGPG